MTGKEAGQLEKGDQVWAILPYSMWKANEPAWALVEIDKFQKKESPGGTYMMPATHRLPGWIKSKGPHKGKRVFVPFEDVEWGSPWEDVANG